MISRFVFVSVLFLCACTIAGCGGGGSSSAVVPRPNEASNQSPAPPVQSPDPRVSPTPSQRYPASISQRHLLTDDVLGSPLSISWSQVAPYVSWALASDR